MINVDGTGLERTRRTRRSTASDVLARRQASGFASNRNGAKKAIRSIFIARLAMSLRTRLNPLTMIDSTIGLLRELVAIDSSNPSLVPGARGEAEIARRIAAS